MVLGFETAKSTPSTVSPSPAARSVVAVPEPDLLAPPPDNGHLGHALLSPHAVATAASHTNSPRKESNMISQDGEVEGRPPYLHVRRHLPGPSSLSRRTPRLPHCPANPFAVLQCMLAGGLGGSTGDMLMHSLDTVKTRQQGDPHIPPKYTSLGSSYLKIFRQEGIRRGLYGGWIPALSGSFPATCLFFGSYEWSKRRMLEHGVQPHLAYLLAGECGPR